MAKARSHIPEGLHSVTPELAVKGGTRAIDFYKQVFGAQEVSRAVGPDGRSILHAQLQVGDSPVFLADIFPQGPQDVRVVMTVFVKDADAVFDRAVKAGAEVVMPLGDAFWGDRYGQVRDPFGHVWAIATHKEDLTPDEMKKRTAEFFASARP